YSCYNLDCDTFVQVDNTVAIGGAYTGSTLNGTQYVTTIEIQQKEDENWWVKRGSKWVGYYPKSAFASNNLQSGAEHFDLGGEVAWTPRETYCSWDTWFGCLAHSTRNARFTHTDMGSGVRPDGISDYGEVAYIRQIEYLNSSQEWTRIKEHTADRVSLKGSDGNCYDLATNLDNSDWMGSTIWYGGPGYGDYCK
ncbi:MAG: neprosin family prolyl endopeptidase, partial [Gammaproteobacteria bacterium]|nr:neprosin family prolyl endopeptidase [Gammaproteobacteria bacterium]